MSVFNVGLFKGPRYSAFPIKHNNKISMKGGKIYPIYWDFLNQGDKIDKVDVSNITRVAPMLAPTLDTYRVDVHAFAVRLRSIGHASRNPWQYEDFFNLNKNVDGSASLPSIPLGLLFSVNGFRTGTLYESMGFPTFKALREEYLDFIRNTCPWVFDSVCKPFVFSEYYVESLRVLYIMPSSIPLQESAGDDPGTVEVYLNDSFWNKFTIVNGDFRQGFFRKVASYVGGNLPYRGTLVDYIFATYAAAFGAFQGAEFNTDDLGIYISNPTDITSDVYNGSISVNLLDEVYKYYKVDSISVLRGFTEWLLDGLLALTNTGATVSNKFSDLYGYSHYSSDTDISVFYYLLGLIHDAFPDLPEWSYASGTSAVDRLIPAYPFEAYWKVICDWYINTAISDPDFTFLSSILDDSLSAFNFTNPSSAECAYIRQAAIRMNALANRYWNNDYFTSAFPSAQAGQAVGIPVNGTIVDLRNANAMQKLKERLLYAGQRFRDVMYAITGKKTSAAILEMSEVLASWSNTINIDSVMQQSETTVNSPQAEYAGTGLGYRSGGKPFSYVADEPTVIIVVASIIPQASYFQGLPRKFVRSNVYDYAIPQLANVGEQPILRGELYLDFDSDSQSVFGYTRRNGDWMWTPNEVHGDFRGSLDFWHNSRVFASKPSLSTSFLEVDESADNLTRIFAVSSSSIDHFYARFDFGGQVIRSLPKHVHYDL